MTEDQRTLALELHKSGKTNKEIAAVIGVRSSTIWKIIRRPLAKANGRPAGLKAAKPQVKRKAQPALGLKKGAGPFFRPPSSIPMRRKIRWEDRNRPPMTKSELYADLALAVRNTDAT